MTHVERIGTVAAPPNGPAVVTMPTKTLTRPAEAAPAVTAPPKPVRVDAKDPRYLALRNFAISMSIFNIFGYTLLGFEQPWLWPFLALALGYTLEIVIERIAAWANRRPPAYSGNGFWGLYTFLLPAHITALACNMLLYANDNFWPIAFGIAVAIGQKAVFQAPIKGRMRHFMNPSNLGITVTLLAFSWVNIAPPYHFTEHVPDAVRIMVPLILLNAGTVLNTMLTKKIPLILGWLGTFVIQAILRAEIWDVSIWGALGPMTGVAFLLFTNYMVTDPGTTPTAPRHQFMFGMGVALVYGVLMEFNVVYTLFFATAIVCAVRGIYHWVLWLRGRRLNAVWPDRTRTLAAQPG